MGRSWSYTGFTSVANAMLKGKKRAGMLIINELDLAGKLVRTYTENTYFGADPHDVPIKEVISQEDCWYGAGPVLEKFTFQDGRVWESYIQAEPWSSGPMTFMALRDFVTKEPIVESLWDQETIDKE